MNHWLNMALVLAGVAIGRLAALKGWGGNNEIAIYWSAIGCGVCALAAVLTHRRGSPKV